MLFIVAEKGKVVLSFATNVRCIGFSSNQAHQLAKALVAAAERVEGGEDVNDLKG